MALVPPRFETQFVTLAADGTPVDLAANATLLPPDFPDDPLVISDSDGEGYRFSDVFVQVIEGNARWRESAAAPAPSDAGHVASTGDGAVLRLERGRSLWFWAPGGAAAELAVSVASAAPVRSDAQYDYDVGVADE